MQMTEETFIWLRSKIAPDESLTFDELYDPDVSIRFGCYYIHLCMERYGGDVATAAAAYHSGWGTVDNLLRMEEHSSDGQTLKGFPYNQMHHYVEKITASYAVIPGSTAAESQPMKKNRQAKNLRVFDR